MQKKKAIAAIRQAGILLVFPHNNQKEPASLWSAFFPRSKMSWKWDSGSDNRVADTWHLMKELSDCREVVYSKWYQGRATFFSRELFTALIAQERKSNKPVLPRESQLLLQTLEDESPLSTKVLKKLTGLQGRFNEGIYQRSLKMLFQKFLVVGYGEVDDGAFPSLAVGASRVLYEELWQKAEDLSLEEAQATIDKFMPAGSKFRKFLERLK